MSGFDVENNAIAINSSFTNEVEEELVNNDNVQGHSNDKLFFELEEVEKENKNEEKEENNKEVTAPQIPGPCNLVCNWSVRKDANYKVIRGQTKGIGKGLNTKNTPATPHAYKILAKYRKNRYEALINRQEEERKKREFHARPMPDFQSLQYQLECKKQPIHQCSVPQTPKVLKESRENNEKRRKRLEELRRDSEAPKFRAREPTVLKEKPFTVQKKPTVLIQQPFNLISERRIQQRKLFEEMFRKEKEEKERKIDEERKQREEEHIKMLRKATNFKAQPNPFKN